MGRPTEHQVFGTYARLWVISESLLHLGDQFLVPHRFWIYAQAVLFAAAFVRPSRAALSASMLARTGMYIVQAPAVWESCYVAILTDLVLVGAMVVHPVQSVVHISHDLVRTLMGIFYVGAGFWKINSSFLDPHVSCASIYVASLLAYLPEPLTPLWLVRPVLRLAPPLTVAGELGLGVGLLLPSRAARRAGVVLSSLLHFAIAVTPHPNQVAGFGVSAG